jgi:predicted aspartyl protease
VRVTSFVITFVTLAASWAARPAAEGAVPFQLFQDSGIIVPVTIDGRGPFQFLLDTGASHSAVSGELAGRLELRPAARTLITTPTGQTWRPVVRVRDLVLGPFSVPEILPSVAGGEYLHDRMRVHGVLGQDVLAGLHYTLDYGRRALSWGGPPPSGRPRVKLPLEWTSGCPIVRTRPAGSRDALRLIPDTGASHIVLFDGGVPALPPHQRVDGMVRLDTLDEHRGARAVLITELFIGPLVLRNQPAAVVDAGRRAADGLLPLHLFQRVTMNGPEGYVLLESW